MTGNSHGLHLPHTSPSPADVRMHADEQSHRRMDTLAWSCLALGIASFVLAALGGSVLGAVLGGIGFGAAIAAQMFSETTSERWVIVPGWAMSALGLILNLFWI